jgi:hypothetical protein
MMMMKLLGAQKKQAEQKVWRGEARRLGGGS